MFHPHYNPHPRVGGYTGNAFPSVRPSVCPSVSFRLYLLNGKRVYGQTWDKCSGAYLRTFFRFSFWDPRWLTMGSLSTPTFFIFCHSSPHYCIHHDPGILKFSFGKHLLAHCFLKTAYCTWNRMEQNNRKSCGCHSPKPYIGLYNFISLHFLQVHVFWCKKFTYMFVSLLLIRLMRVYVCVCPFSKK